jgi:hypothetical protein
MSLGKFLGWFFAAFVGLLFWIGMNAPPKSEEEVRCGTDFDAKVMAEVFVEKQLVAPTTADFPAGMQKTKIVRRPDCKWIVSGYLDSQNEFGAMIRSDYIAEITKIPNEDRWIADKISLFP